MRFTTVTTILLMGIGLVEGLAIPHSSMNSGSALELFKRKTVKAPACKVEDKSCGSNGCPKMVSYLYQTTCRKTRKTRTGLAGRAVDTAEDLWDRALSGRRKRPECPKAGRTRGGTTRKTKEQTTQETTEPRTRTHTRTRARTGTTTCRGRSCRRGDEVDTLNSPAFSPTMNTSAFPTYFDQSEAIGDLENDSKDFGGIFGLVKRAGNALEKRLPRGVRMDQAAGRPWSVYNTMSTSGISHCSVLVLYTDVEIAMAHIPQSRISRDGTITWGGQVIAEHLRTLGYSIDMYHYTPRAIFYYNNSLTTVDDEEKNQILNWLISLGIPRENIVEVTHDGGREGSGRLTITHMGNGQPAHHVLD